MHMYELLIIILMSCAFYRVWADSLSSGVSESVIKVTVLYISYWFHLLRRSLAGLHVRRGSECGELHHIW